MKIAIASVFLGQIARGVESWGEHVTSLQNSIVGGPM